MKTLYIECGMGAAGDMLMAALSELIPEPEAFIQQMNALGLPGVRFERRPAEKCGIRGTHIAVTVHGREELEHGHFHGEDGECHHHGDGHEHHHGDEHHHSHEDEHDHFHGDGHDHHHEDEHEHSHEDEHHHHHGDEHHHSHEDEHNHFHGDEHHHHHEDEHPHFHEDEHPHSHGDDHDHPHGGGEHGHFHASLADVEGVIAALPLPEEVRADAAQVYRLIARAESEVHGRPMDQIHFHEVGTLDAIADVVGVCALMARLNPDQVVVSPIHVGCGQVRCAHGVLPVPAPATARILEGVPIYGGRIRGELCTPTGAALLKHFAHRFGDMPAMRVSQTGYGMGTKDFEWANCVRAMIGDTDDGAESVAELACNLDDMTAEEIAFAMEALLEAGALDVTAQPILMKKGRPATMLTCLCPPEDEDKFAQLMLRHTTTLGVRCHTLRRHTLRREIARRQTPLGEVREKRATGADIDRVKLEYDDVARIARREGLTLREAREMLAVKED